MTPLPSWITDRFGRWGIRAAASAAAPDTSWLLGFEDGVTQRRGRPWGAGTAVAGQQQGRPPWDAGCLVRPLIGGFEAMAAPPGATATSVTVTMPAVDIDCSGRAQIGVAVHQFGMSSVTKTVTVLAGPPPAN